MMMFDYGDVLIWQFDEEVWSRVVLGWQWGGILIYPWPVNYVISRVASIELMLTQSKDNIGLHRDAFILARNIWKCH